MSLAAKADEGYSRNVPDEGYSRNVPDEGYSRNVPDEGYSRNRELLNGMNICNMYKSNSSNIITMGSHV
jgi:hypothetical protein